jgi:hypothetical protein
MLMYMYLHSELLKCASSCNPTTVYTAMVVTLLYKLCATAVLLLGLYTLHYLLSCA